jgi:hypothetical protein
MNTRIITAKQYQQVMSIAARAERDTTFLALPAERLQRFQAWLQESDKQAGEQLEFEQPNAHEVLDQKLLGWRYFMALNYLRQEAVRRIAELELADVFGDTAQ